MEVGFWDNLVIRGVCRGYNRPITPFHKLLAGGLQNHPKSEALNP